MITVDSVFFFAVEAGVRYHLLDAELTLRGRVDLVLHLAHTLALGLNLSAHNEFCITDPGSVDAFRRPINLNEKCGGSAAQKGIKLRFSCFSEFHFILEAHFLGVLHAIILIFLILKLLDVVLRFLQRDGVIQILILVVLAAQDLFA